MHDLQSEAGQVTTLAVTSLSNDESVPVLGMIWQRESPRLLD